MTAPVRREPWTLRQRVTALCLLAATVLTFLAAGATTTALANRGQLDRLLDQIGPMRTASTELRAALVAEQAGVRGYVLSTSDVDRLSYRAAVEAEARPAAVIDASPAATPEIRQKLASVTGLARAWRTSFGDPAVAAVDSGGSAAGSALLTAAADRQFDQILVEVTAMQGLMQVVRNASVQSIKDTSSTLLFVLIVAAALVIASGVGLMVALGRLVTTPVTDLAAQVRSVARGNYDRVITTNGPPELERLARDVDVMRQQIASDLAEVESSRRFVVEANARLEQQAAELLRSNRDLEQFAYVASHDLQEPLRKVASFCQLLQRRYEGQLDERADQYISFAVNGAQRMQRLINDLLAFSRIGRNTAGFTDVDLTRLITDTVAQLDSTIEATGAVVEFADLPVVCGEEPLLATLFLNLIGNSIKFRRPDVSPSITISARREDDHWEVSCVDNGIGIEREFADKVFVIFQRLHPRDAYPGTGIGLAVVKKIVEYHGGTIWIDDSVSPGAAIRFTLPVNPVPVEATVDERAKEPVA